MNQLYDILKGGSLATVRSAIRSGSYRFHTAGLGRGHLQANIAIMPEEFALDFMRYCQRNPKPCPLVGVSDTGNPMMFTLGGDIDIRSDVPAYNIYRKGRLSETVPDISDHWRSDLVAFALGCSFTFEHAVRQAGVDLWHIENNTTVPMYRSNIQTVPAGSFRGTMAVSMRAIPNHQLEMVRKISRNFPLAHGAPVHVGDPLEIGISNVESPDWGDPSPITADHTPVFWACGVTPQIALENVGMPICITHKPGHMLIADVPDNAETPIFPLSQQPQQGVKK